MLITGPSLFQTLISRVQTWQVLRHPHVLQVFGVSPMDADPLYVISHYYPDGNANDFLLKNPDADRGKIASEPLYRLRSRY
jgi:hypothetical protein